ncbi:MAG: hypothetical protein AAGJ87_04060 [Pseudomonadota bacterium]
MRTASASACDAFARRLNGAAPSTDTVRRESVAGAPDGQLEATILRDGKNLLTEEQSVTKGERIFLLK